jgi:hypothetical protein
MHGAGGASPLVFTTRNASTRKMSELEGVEVGMGSKEALKLFLKVEMTARTKRARA